MSKQFLLIFVLFAMLFSACETRETGNIKDVTQSEIYQDLSFTSDGSSTNVKATLSFAGVRGTTLKLTNPSKVLFNGQPMDEKNGQYSGTYYEKTFNEVLSGGTFAFTDTKGKTYTNKVELPAIDFKTLPTQINRATVTKLPIVNGAKIGESNVILKISYEDKQGFQGKDISVFPQKQDVDSAYFDAKTQSIIIEPAIWQSIKSNKIKVEIISKSSQNLQQGTTIGGKITSEYNGKTATLILSGNNIATVSPVIPKANANVNTKIQTANTSVNANIPTTANTNSVTNIANSSTSSPNKKPLAKKRFVKK
jgi:hypothetical protein